MKHHLLVILLLIIAVGNYDKNERKSFGTDGCSLAIEQFKHGYGHPAYCNEAEHLHEFDFENKLPNNICFFEITYLKSTDYETLIIAEEKKKSSDSVGNLNSLTVIINIVLLVTLATVNRLACNHRQVSTCF